MTEVSSAAGPYALIAALCTAMERAHNETTLGAELAQALSTSLPLVELTLQSTSGQRTWLGRCAGQPRAREHGVALGDGRTLTLSLARTEVLADGLDVAVAALLRASFSQVGTLARVAALSHRAFRDRERLRAQLDASKPRIVAESPAMRHLVQVTLPLVAHSDVTVLIRGETGTGKELIARRIHGLSSRARRPFVAINCGALPESLAESALFGHERGAFSGAVQSQIGVFEQADRGSLFLDEVGELSLATQARLLRVLGNHEVTRLGSTTSRAVDVRVLAATHRPLEAMVREGLFREDLYYRLHVVPIDVPPLRERPEDLEPLVQRTLETLALKLGRPTPRLGPRELALLLARPWPGNVRELENVIHRAMVLSEGDDLDLTTLASDASRLDPRLEVKSPLETRAESFEDAQRRILEAALDACQGRIYGADGAAARLGLRPTTLQSKLEKLGLRKS